MFEHPALFYGTEKEYLAGTVPFIQDGLAAGLPVAVAVPGPNLALIRSELGEDAVRVRLLDMTIAGRNPGRIIPGVLRAFADRHPDDHVKIIGEPIWAGRSAVEYPACAQHEALINLAFADRDVSIMCPYDVSALSAQALADAYATHPVLMDAHGTWESPDYDPERIIELGNLPLPDPVEEIVTALEFSADNLSATRDLTLAHGTRAGMEADRVLDAELAVNELAANSIRHGGGCGTLRVWTQDQHMIFQVEDAGRLTDPLTGRHPVADSVGGGRGVLLVNHLADLVRIHTSVEGTRIRAYFRL